MNFKSTIKDIAVFFSALVLALLCGVQLLRLDVEEHITTVFIFAVFLVSIFTRGYFYGIAFAVIGTVAVNFAFTYPYFTFDFVSSINLISAVIMVTVSVITSLMVTKIKKHELAKAEGEREKMRANLLRAVSHDLRTPLTTIYSASSVLRENGDKLTKEQYDGMLKSIQEDSEWLMRMVENLLSVTRIDNETMAIHKTPTILDELIDSVVKKFTQRHPEQKIQLDIPDEIVVIPMDAILIEQVILNILENSVYHAEGMTWLSLRVFTLSNQAIFEISDNGCGLAENKLKGLFSGYYERRQDTACENKRFAGIGLSVCATIINAHSGTITAENRKGGGALFRFTLAKEDETLEQQ